MIGHWVNPFLILGTLALHCLSQQNADGIELLEALEPQWTSSGLIVKAPKPSYLTGNVTIAFNIDNFQQIYAETLILLRGGRFAYHFKIRNTSIHLPNVAIGAYTLLLPTGKSTKYAIDQAYLMVDQENTKLDINFTIRTSNQLVHQYINLLGYSDLRFASIFIDLPNQMLLIDVTNKTPHLVFTKTEYAHIIVKKSNGEELFRKSIEGANVSLSSDQVKFEFGYQLDIFHLEPFRLRLSANNNSQANKFSFSSKSNLFTLTEIGLKHASVNPHAYLKLVMDEVANDIRKHPELIYQKYLPLKDDLYLAINVFPVTEREQLHSRYADVLLDNNDAPGQYAGNIFSITFNGLNDWTFFNATIDFVRQEIAFQIKTGRPHHYFFTNPVYASIHYLDANGLVQFNHEFLGETKYDASMKTIPLSHCGGEMIILLHREASFRRFLRNEMQGATIPNKNTIVVYRVVNSGLELIKSMP